MSLVKKYESNCVDQHPWPQQAILYIPPDVNDEIINSKKIIDVTDKVGIEYRNNGKIGEMEYVCLDAVNGPTRVVYNGITKVFSVTVTNHCNGEIEYNFNLTE